MSPKVGTLPPESQRLSESNPGGNEVPPEPAALVFAHTDATPRRALVVEDVPGVRSALTRALRECGLFVLCAPDQRAAMRVLGDRWVDVVIAEHRPPEFHGIALLEQVRRAHPHTHRVVITGQPTFAVMREAINRAGVSFILTKPWDSEALRGALRNLLGGDPIAATPPLVEAEATRETAGVERAAVRAQKILSALNACDKESQIRMLLQREFARITAADGFWWIDESERTLSEFSLDGARIQECAIDALDAHVFELVDRARRADRPVVLEVSESTLEEESGSRSGMSILVAPLRCRGRDLGTFGVKARREGLLFGTPLAVCEAVAEGVALALQRARREEGKIDALRGPEDGTQTRVAAVDIESLVAETVEKMRVLPGPAVSIFVTSEAGIPEFRADPKRLEHALWNALLEAKAAVGTSGSVRVSARRRRRGGCRGVEIAVEDEATLPAVTESQRSERGRESPAGRQAEASSRRSRVPDAGGARVAFWLPMLRG